MGPSLHGRTSDTTRGAQGRVWQASNLAPETPKCFVSTSATTTPSSPPRSTNHLCLLISTFRLDKERSKTVAKLLRSAVRTPSTRGRDACTNKELSHGLPPKTHLKISIHAPCTKYLMPRGRRSPQGSSSQHTQFSNMTDNGRMADRLTRERERLIAERQNELGTIMERHDDLVRFPLCLW